MKILKFVRLVFLLIIVPAILHGQTNTDFWFAAPEVTAGHGDNPIYLRLTSFSQTATVIITEPANTTTNFPPIYLTIPANTTTSVNLTSVKSQVECQPANTVLDYGLHIHSDVAITVYYEVAHYFNPELFTLKGNNALGTSFYIPSQNVMYNDPAYSPTAYSSFDIVATEDNTTVYITPKKAITGHPAGIQFSVVLNQGQVYSARASSNAASEHLMGSVVTSDKPVSITVKDDSDRYTGQGCADLTGDQIVPVNIIGTDYIVVRGYTNNSMNDWFFVTATADNTQVSVNGTGVTTLSAGNTYASSMTTGNLCTSVHTDKPVYLWHLTGYGCEAGSSLLPAMNCTGSTQVAFNRTTAYSFELIVLTKVGAQGSFLMDGNPNLITAVMFATVPGNPAYVYARIDFASSVLSVGAHMLTNTADIFHMGVIQTYDATQAGCAYGFFSDFASLNLGSDKTVCPGVPVTFDAGPNRQSYAWFFNGTPYLSGVQTITVTNPGIYSVTVNDHGCDLSDTVQLFNFPAPAPVITGVTSFCQGAAEQLTVSSAFNSYLWSTGATTQSITVSASGIYSVTVTGSTACPGTTSANVTVHPLPTVTLAQPSPTCSNVAPFVLTGGTPAGGIYSGPGVNSGTGVFNPGSGTGAHLITYTYTDAAGCTNSASKTLTVNAPPPATLATQPAVCFSAPPFALSGGWPSGGVYSGPGVNSVTGIFTPSSGTGAHLITYTYTDLNGCAATATKTLTVNPVPVVSLGVQPAVCVSASPFPLSGGSPPGGVYSGTGVNSGTGYFTPATGAGGYQITYTFTDINGCSSAAYEVLTVHPLPQVQLAQFPTACISGSAFLLTGGSPAGGTYSGPGVNSVTGYFDPSSGLGPHEITYTYTDGNGCTASDIKTLMVTSLPDVQLADLPPVCISVPPFPMTGGTPWGGYYSGSGVNLITGYFDPATGTGDHMITYTYTDGSGCVNTASKIQTVLSIPEVQLADLPAVCISAPPYPLTGGVPSGGVYSGPGVNSLTGYFDPSVGAGTHQVTYTVTAANGCTNSVIKPVTVNPSPFVQVSGQEGACISAAPFLLTFGTPGGGIYSGPGVNSLTSYFNPASGAGAHELFYSYTDANGCTSAVPKTLTVYALPDVQFTLQNSVCISAPSFTLDGGTPSGGTYSGTGVNSGAGTFDPASGAGPHEVTYTFSDGYGCTNFSTKTITVNALPVVHLADQPSKCLNNPAFQLSGGAPSGGVYSGPGVNPVTGIFDPASGTGPHLITYTYTDGNGCTDVDSRELTVLPLPVVGLSPLAPVCVNAAPFLLTGGSPAGGSYSGDGVNTVTGIFTPAPPSGPKPITYSFTDGAGCTSTSSASLTVNPLPEVQLSVPAEVCITAPAFLLTGGSPAGGIYTGTGVMPSTGYFNPASGAGIHEITYTFSDINSCINQEKSSLPVIPLPLPAGTISGPMSVCESSVNLTYQLSGADPLATSFNWELYPSTAGSVTGNSPSPLVSLAAGFAGNLGLRFQPVSNCGEGIFSGYTFITVNENPSVALQPCNDPVTTRNAKPFLLKGGTPVGGSYAVDGTLLPSGILNPGSLSSAITDHIISYSYTNIHNCSAVKTISLKVISGAAFVCKNTLTDPRDQQRYPTFEISSGGTRRCWMSANLNYGSFTADQLPQTDNCLNEKYCGSNDSSNCSLTGGFYQWDELMAYQADGSTAEGRQGLCPPEWHVATEAEWEELLYYYDNPGLAGWNMIDNIAPYGFHAKPAGILYQNLSWSFLPPGIAASIFWSSTVYPADNSRIITHGLNDVSPSVSTYYSLRGNALPVRCVQN